MQPIREVRFALGAQARTAARYARRILSAFACEQRPWPHDVRLRADRPGPVADSDHGIEPGSDGAVIGTGGERGGEMSILARYLLQDAAMSLGRKFRQSSASMSTIASKSGMNQTGGHSVK
jgi:hypothetical protein